MAEPTDALMPLATGGSLAALLLAGIGADLLRRRRQFQRFRRPGERLPMPAPVAADIERTTRSAAQEPGLDLLDRSLGHLAEQARAKGVPVPGTRLVLLAEASVTLVLAEATDEAIAPFRAVGPTRWELDDTLLPAGSTQLERSYPGLLVLGSIGRQTVLLNLEAVGTLGVVGEASAVADVTRSIAAELALGPIASLTERTLCLSDPAIAGAVEPGTLAVQDDPRLVAASLARRLGQPRPSRNPEGEDPLEVVLTDRPLGVVVPPWSGCALIAMGQLDGVGAVLHVGAGGGHLEPDGLALTPQGLSAVSCAGVVELLRATDVPDEAGEGALEARRANPASDDGRIIDLREPTSVQLTGPGAANSSSAGPAAPGPAAQALDAAGPDPSASDPAAADAAAPRVLLLGQVEVANAHGKAESSRIGRLAETTAFVLLNPGSRPSQLQGALWPGRRANPQTCRQMISRTRTWLGRTEQGDSYLMPFAETQGRLRLRPEVGSDWADFQTLAARGLADPDDIEHLTAALSLVRGRPFGAVASRELPWADLFVNEMISLVADVAHELAVRHERAGRWAAARDAALRGLLTECESEVLERMVERLR